jgi:NAD+ kinase
MKARNAGTPIKAKAKGAARGAGASHASAQAHSHGGIPDLALHDPHITYPERDVRSIGVMSFSGNMAAAMDILNRWADENPKIQVYINNYLKPFANGRLKSKPETFLSTKVDLLLSLGGDGTFLSAARMVRGAGTPILGVNLGRVGFLADVTLESLHRILDEILRRDYSYRRRMLIQVEVWKGRHRVLEDIALNDVAIAGQMGYQMVDLRVSAQGRFLTDYWVDGLIFSTPTGSTAYSLSAGGPIIHPSADSILVTPMNPTSLSVRPLVLPEYITITVRSNLGSDKEVRMFVDGRNQFELKPDHTVIIRKHPVGVRLVRPKGSFYFDSLRNKLGWTGSRHSRYTAPGLT